MLPRLRPPRPNNTARESRRRGERRTAKERHPACEGGVLFFCSDLSLAGRRAAARLRGTGLRRETWDIEICDCQSDRTKKERNGGKQPCTMKLFHQTPVSAHADPQASPENAKADMAITISAVCKDRRACIATLQKVVEKPNRPHNTRGPRPSRMESDTTASRDVVTTRHGASS